jgi:hypothetical protein
VASRMRLLALKEWSRLIISPPMAASHRAMYLRNTHTSLHTSCEEQHQHPVKKSGCHLSATTHYNTSLSSHTCCSQSRHRFLQPHCMTTHPLASSVELRNRSMRYAELGLYMLSLTGKGGGWGVVPCMLVRVR